jgi:hypothetical protein
MRLGHDFRVLGDEPPPELTALMERISFTITGRREQVGELSMGGVTLVSGVESGVHPVRAHGSLPAAVIELIECSVPTTPALASATSLAAQVCG